jgi:putative endonuclease
VSGVFSEAEAKTDWSGTMWDVYIIRSATFPEHDYVGATANLRQRLAYHNAGKSAHTAKFIPWELVWYPRFPTSTKL